MKTLLTSLTLLLVATASAQTGPTGGINVSAKNNGSLGLTLGYQQNLIAPRDLNLLAGIGAFASNEGKQALHLVGYSYGSMEIGDVQVSIRAGVSRTRNWDTRLIESMGARMWSAYTGVQIEWNEDKPARGFVRLDVSPRNFFMLAIGAKINL